MANPADLCSRGCTAEQLENSALWWTGPEFLMTQPIQWPADIKTEKQTEDLEMKKSSPDAIEMAQEISDNFLTIFNRFGTWHKTVRFFAYILRMGYKPHTPFRKKRLSVQEERRTENFLWRISQKRGFAQEIRDLQKTGSVQKTSKICDYNPKYDLTNGWIISESRLTQSDLPDQTRRPVMLPKNCEIVAKYIQHIHACYGHAGPEYALSLMRQKFRLCQGRRQIRKVLRKCSTPRCVAPTPLTQQMAPLPDLRTDSPAAFRICAVDLFGPMYAKHWCQFNNCPHPQEKKVYGALFTCFHSRAVHLELIEDQGTEEFLNALRSFVGRRGMPEVIQSDNAKNFKTADKELRQLYRSIDWNKVEEDGRQRRIEWIFTTAVAPWHNAVAERMVRSVKKPLRLILGRAKLTFRQLAIVLTEVEGIVNNRPLRIDSDHVNDLTPITPAELIIGRRMDQIPDPNQRHWPENVLHLWRRRKELLNQFWRRWQNDYLTEQNVRKKWHKPTEKDLIGKVVLLKEDNMKRNMWKLARIQDVVKSKDGLIRTAIIRTATSGNLRRPIQKLALLEAEDE